MARHLRHDRGKVLWRAGELIRERADAIGRTLTLEEGKPLAEAVMEVKVAADIFQWYAEEGRRAYGRLIPSRLPGTRQMVIREPVGPVAAFTPWNFPAVTPARKMAGALGAGCSCIIKPSEETPGTAVAMARALHEAGLPRGVLSVVFGVPSQVSEHLVPSPIIRKVTFTGSIPVGKHLTRLAADGMKRTTMELGGHAPVVVFDDVDVDKAATVAAGGKFRNAGQVCVSPTRFFVHEKVYGKFVKKFTEIASGLKLGNGLDETVGMGPPRQWTAGRRDRRIRERRPRLRRGRDHRRRAGRQPGLLLLPHRARGRAGQRPDDVRGAFRTGRADAVVDGLRRGDGEGQRPGVRPRCVCLHHQHRACGPGLRTPGDGAGRVNHCAISFAETPFGGVKESGYGHEGGIEGLDAYLTSKFVTQMNA